MINGVINIYKEQGYTSFDVVARLRRLTHIRKIGHTGTLDPMAEGVLPVCIGSATKLVDMITDHTKTYVTTMKLGLTTDSEDITGNVLTTAEPGLVKSLTESQIIEAVNSFVGEYDQVPPMYSAKKINGQKLCDLARKGIVVDRKAKRIAVYSIKILNIALPEISLEIHCSRGTYIRTICSDIGSKLKVGAVMTSLTRTQVGDFRIENSIKLKEVEERLNNNSLECIIIGVDMFFAEYPAVTLHEKDVPAVSNGNWFETEGYKEIDFTNNCHYRIYDSNGLFYAVYFNDNGTMKPWKMFLNMF